MLSIVSYPFLVLFKFIGLVQSSADTALFIRLILATLLAASLIFFSYRVHNRKTLILQRRAFIIICSVQFHLLFWAGRTTPNGLVSPIVFFALALILSTNPSRYHARDYYIGLSLLTTSTIIGRMELIGIVIPVALCGLFSSSLGGRIVSRFIRIALTGLNVAMISIGKYKPKSEYCTSSSQNLFFSPHPVISVLVDTYFWGRPFLIWNPLDSTKTQARGLLWPELEAILFNVVQGKSSEWGVSEL